MSKFIDSLLVDVNDMEGNELSKDSPELAFIRQQYKNLVDAEDEAPTSNSVGYNEIFQVSDILAREEVEQLITDNVENLTRPEANRILINAGYKASQRRDKLGRWFGGQGAAFTTVSKGKYAGTKMITVTLKGATKEKVKRPSGVMLVMKGGKWVDSNGRPAPEHAQKLANSIGRNLVSGWKEIHVNPDPKATLLMIGRDSKGRVQGRYSQNHTSRQAAAKFGKVSELRAKRAKIFKEIETDRKKPALKENAECLKLIMQTGIRPGGGSTKADHRSFGATTIQGRHVLQKTNGEVYLRFATGKNRGREVSFPIRDKDTQKMLLQRKKKAGSLGKLFDTNAGSLREYSKSKDGKGFKTKDHRTALGTETAISVINSYKRLPSNPKRYKKMVFAVGDEVAKTLGNTRSIALKSYIDPSVFLPWKHKAGVE